MSTLWLTYGTRTVVEDCEDAWDARTGDITTSADASIYVIGAKSSKMLSTSGLVPGTKMASEAISSANYSALTHALYWTRCTQVKVAGDFELMLDNTADCASPVESIAFEAIPYADQWYRHCVPLATPASDTAIISVGVTAGSGAFATGNALYVDDVEVTTARSFSVYAVRGINRPDEVQTFPGLSGTLLDGSGYEMIHSWRRVITIELQPLTSPTDINFLLNWALSPTKYVVYGSDDIPVMLEDASRLVNEWMGGVDLFRRWTLRLIEKTARTTVPSSWGYSI